MLKLIVNENAKIYRRLRTWILLGIVLVAMIAIALVVDSTQHSNQNWRQTVVTEDARIRLGLQHKQHMPAAVVQQNEQALQVNEYSLLHNIDPNQTTAWNFAQNATHLSVLLTAFIVVIAGDIVAFEFSTGTIKMLLTQTASRSQILLSKYLATILYILFMTIAMLLFSWLVGGLFFGFAGASEPHFYTDAGGQVAQMTVVQYTFMSYGFQLIQIVLTATIAFMISTIFRSSALAITISILAYLIGSTLVTALSSFAWDKYILFANTNLQQYVEGGPAIHDMTLGFLIAMLFAYYIVMLVLAWAVFIRRDVAYT